MSRNGLKIKKTRLPRQSTFGDEIVNSLKDFSARTDRGEPITLRTVALDIHIQNYTPSQIRSIRKSLNVSQSAFAKFLGVSVLTVQSWEQGTRRPSPMACRFLDEIATSLEYWRRRLADAIVTT